MENGFVKIPRAWFEKNGVWGKLNSEQRGALVTLCSVVAYDKHGYKTERGVAILDVGQIAVSRCKLAEILGLSEWRTRHLVELLKKENIISIDSFEPIASKKTSKLTILTVNHLHNIASKKTSLDKRNINKINIKKEIIKKEVQHRFVPPTAEEVQAYLDEKGITSFTGADFVAYYEQGGWVYGKSHTPVKNWKACVSTWMRFGNQTTNYGNTKTDIYCNGYAGREERQRIFEQHIIEQLTKPHIEPELPF